ncbi:MAG: hypothetical protein M3Q58_00340 [Bacteroidota bacterium]|nr:hypothetical protein [Bacteroidota bacterium]
MKKSKKDKERDIALQTPDKGKKSKSNVPPDRAGSDEEKAKRKGINKENDSANSDAQAGHGLGNEIDKGQEGAQGYGKYQEE